MESGRKDFDFSKMAESYDESMGGRAVRPFYNLLLSEIALAEGMRLLDVGCGTGAMLKRICGNCRVEAHGIDVEANMIAVAERKCPDITFNLAPAENMPYPDGYFDALTACLAYHHLPDKAGFAREASRVLKTGGVLYIVDPNFPYALRKCMNAVIRLFKVVGEFFTSQEIAETFQAYGFAFAGAKRKGFAQIVTLTRTG